MHYHAINSCVYDDSYNILVYLQFTLCYILKGNKPDFHQAMSADQSKVLYESFLDQMKADYSPDKIKGIEPSNCHVYNYTIH